MDEAQKIVFFDGGCLLCSGAVQWTHQRDRKEEIWFAALESEFAATYREELGLPVAGEGAETFAFWDRESGKVAFKSDGGLALLRNLGGFWGGLSALFALCPRVIRDRIYDLIARNRRKWFETSETCTLPPASLRGKVLS